LQKFTKALNKTIVGFAPSAMQTLLNFQYPGNIRELSNIVEYAVNICAKKKITTEHLPPYIFDQQIKDQDSLPGLEVDKAVESKNSGNQEKFDTSAPQPESWFEIERQLIVDMLKEQRGNRTKAAKRLGWGRMTLWRKMKKYGLQE
jgi:DNA-binding NtrC family response regulator